MKKILFSFVLSIIFIAVSSISMVSAEPCPATGPKPAGCTTSTPSTNTPSTSTGSTNCSYDKNSTQLCNPISGANDLNSLIIKGLRFALGLIGTVAVLMIVIAGFKMVASQGNESQVKSAKATITWSIIGLVVAFLAYSIVAIIQTVLIK